MEASELLNRITKAKRSQARLHRFLYDADPALGALVNGCGTWLHFREWLNCGETRLMGANFCKRHLLCQACAVRRAGKMNQAYLAKVEHIASEFPQCVPAMVTITVKNGFDLAERLQHLKDGWKTMIAARRRYLNNPDRHPAIEWAKVLGSIRAIEVSKAKDGQWHPHIHAFVMLSSYIDQAKFSAEWEQWTGDSKIVGVTKCKNGFAGGLREVLKYSCKFSSMTPEDVYYVHSTLSGSRLIDPQGLLRGVRVPSIDSDDIEGLEGPYRDFIASWIHDQQRYHLSKRHTGPLTFIRPDKPTPLPSPGSPEGSLTVRSERRAEE